MFKRFKRDPKTMLFVKQNLPIIRSCSVEIGSYQG